LFSPCQQDVIHSTRSQVFWDKVFIFAQINIITNMKKVIKVSQLKEYISKKVNEAIGDRQQALEFERGEAEEDIGFIRRQELIDRFVKEFNKLGGTPEELKRIIAFAEKEKVRHPEVVFDPTFSRLGNNQDPEETAQSAMNLSKFLNYGNYGINDPE
jgi:predicted nucleotidyltransferase